MAKIHIKVYGNARATERTEHVHEYAKPVGVKRESRGQRAPPIQFCSGDEPCAPLAAKDRLDRAKLGVGADGEGPM